MGGEISYGRTACQYSDDTENSENADGDCEREIGGGAGRAFELGEQTSSRGKKTFEGSNEKDEKISVKKRTSGRRRTAIS
jgi:hypothetical protein